MKFISSPAKLMNVENSTEFLKNTTPKFIKDSEFIHSFLKEKSPKYLSELMEISPKLADENWERNQKWTAKPTSKNSAPAMFAFTGEVYRGLDAKTLDEKAVKYLEKNFRILSGLYGLLKPSDKIMLYRLEMGRAFHFDSYKNLYEFWTDKVTQQLNSELKKDQDILDVLSSDEFSLMAWFRFVFEEYSQSEKGLLKKGNYVLPAMLIEKALEEGHFDLDAYLESKGQKVTNLETSQESHETTEF